MNYRTFLTILTLFLLPACTSDSQKDEYIRVLEETNRSYRRQSIEDRKRWAEDFRDRAEFAVLDIKKTARLMACLDLITDEQKYEIMNQVWPWEAK